MQDWKGAVEEFRKSSSIKQTPEVAAALKNASAELEVSENKSAASAALQQSHDFEQKQDYLQAYEVLANLPVSQRSFVADDM